MSEFFYTSNNDPTYYETNRCGTNCGSYALRLKEWYDNELDEEWGGIDAWIEELINEEIPCAVIPDIIAEQFINELINDFPDGEVTQLSSVSLTTMTEIKKKSVELIAFRVYVPIEEYLMNDYGCFDFHFRVWREGHWMEKNGSQEVHQCNLTDWGKYNSSTFFLLHKIV